MYHHAEALRYAFHIDAKRGRDVFLFPPASERGNQQEDSQEPESVGPGELATHDVDLTPFSQGTSVATPGSAIEDDPRKEREPPKKKIAIEIDTQLTQNAQNSLTGNEALTNENPKNEALTISQKTRQDMCPAVSAGYMSTGVHRLNFSKDGASITREYATPVSHYAKRKRWPEVAAPSKVLHKESNEMGPPGENILIEPANQRNHSDSPRAPNTALDSTSKNTVEGSLWNTNFAPGGHLRTVPQNN